jgi:hypothetical protein
MVTSTEEFLSTLCLRFLFTHSSYLTNSTHHSWFEHPNSVERLVSYLCNVIYIRVACKQLTQWYKVISYLNS